MIAAATTAAAAEATKVELDIEGKEMKINVRHCRDRNFRNSSRMWGQTDINPTRNNNMCTHTHKFREYFWQQQQHQQQLIVRSLENYFWVTVEASTQNHLKLQ